ncbi:MAG: LexA family protein [Paludibacteraceae bacterium]
MKRIKKSFETTVSDIRKIDSASLELVDIGQVSAGAFITGDFSYERIDLNRELIKHPERTFIGTIRGNSLEGLGIYNNDRVLIEKGFDVYDGKVYIYFVDDGYTAKILKKDKDCLWLVAANDEYKPIQVTEQNKFFIWGRIIHTIHTF